ncbi:glutamyl-tRNA ligase [Candidatus Mycoplasma haematolamae str. Purdue]|uniref:Glutamate--tRNA ligase n=1 Tax=Mycoplasma haematolamae (strain Purdue) TaxID=1212765 RepID=I7C595_MYCHA|nr:glutamate--tRNA ligase [Candidatus Mycoplasma haematolamae]AFO51682.1 glutamyl-tRNA ligase [Candidatus Mycoplasma haematolamae str. Purdue]
MGNFNRTRTRFAPSPTGSLHLGGLRTALINYLFAKQNNGDFILRIEDTDTSRNQEDQVRKILDDLESLRLIPDESFACPGEYGPYLQSQRLDKYTARAKELIEKGKAYRCFCTQEELDKEREEDNQYIYSGKCRYLKEKEVADNLAAKKLFSVRLKVEKNKTYSWKDYVRGEMSIPSSALGDIILIRSNGIPMYNFAAAVDDYEMKISDIFRGEEHLSNTPYQLALYKAFGWEEFIPSYGHLSLIASESGRKISKRDPDSYKYYVNYFLERGFYPEALLNYLLILGWTEGEREFFTVKEAISAFKTETLSGSPSIFDFKKLEWMSQSYLNKLDLLQYLNFVLPFFKSEHEEFTAYPEKRRDFAVCFRSRVKYASFLEDLAEEFYSLEYLKKEGLDSLKSFESSITLIDTALTRLKERGPDNFVEIEIRLFLKQLLVKLELPRPDVFKNLRLALIGEKEGLPLHSVIYLLGYSRTLERLEKVKNLLGQ